MALSANTALQTRNTTGKLRNFVVKTSSVIYKHALCCVNAAGTLVAAANTTTTTFVGVAEDGPVTGDGTKTVNCIVDGEFLITIATTLTKGLQTSSAVYATDDSACTNVATLGPVVGVMTQWVSSTTGWIGLRQATLAKAS